MRIRSRSDCSRFEGPPALQVRPMLGVAWTLLSRTAFTMTAFIAVTSWALTQGTRAAAAHQVALQFFWFLTCAPLRTLASAHWPWPRP